MSVFCNSVLNCNFKVYRNNEEFMKIKGYFPYTKPLFICSTHVLTMKFSSSWSLLNLKTNFYSFSEYGNFVLETCYEQINSDLACGN